ncbi:MAG: N-acetylmuramoyl-L-alanine amidase [Chitinophagaceae bacterium]|nr:N-acetylmuramoyl-L-alanine amidase [Chitinophagaceae bacterium]MCW5927397.1 N-acetylmuramoyl-L-alanine amidase [Chitinophagaceae bacterium]
MQKWLIASTVVFLGLLSSQLVLGQNKKAIKTIIVDAGHGGREPGARGSYSTEAELTLKFSLKVAEMLRDQLPGINIVETRTTDVFHNVREKADFANKNNGDLFVCIHVNAAPPIRHSEVTGYRNRVTYTGKGNNRKKVTKREPVYRRWTTPNPRIGTETYVWAADRDDAKAGAIAERFESVEDTLDIPDINSPEGIIASRLWVQRYFKNSIRLASLVEEEFVNIGRKSWGVKQRNEKGIWVLQATNMPAVLIETGFITNKEEEDYLNSVEGQMEMSEAMVRAVVKYVALINGPSTDTAGNAQ